LIIDKRQEIRDKAAWMLWDLLKKYNFTTPFWDTIYEIILGYIPKSFLHLISEDPKSTEYVKTTMLSLIDIVTEKFDMLEKRCIDLIEKLDSFICETDEQSAKTGIEIHKAFITKIASKLQKDSYWEQIIKDLQKVLNLTLPKKLLDSNAIINGQNPGEIKLGFNEQEVLSKSLIHLNMVNYAKTTLVKEILHFIPNKVAVQLMEILNESATFAHEFNQNVDLRFRLRKAGFRKESTQLPTLIHQEREALSGYLELSYSIYEKNPNNEETNNVLDKMWM